MLVLILGLLCPWDSQGKNNGVGFHALLQGIFLTHGSNLCLLCLPAPPLPALPPSCFPVPTPSSSSSCPSSCPLLPPPILLFLPSGPPPFPLLLPCPRGRAQRVVIVNLGSSSWSPGNKASPPAQGLSRGLINLRKTSLVSADLSRAEATLPWRRDLALQPLGPQWSHGQPQVCGGGRQRRSKEK